MVKKKVVSKKVGRNSSTGRFVKKSGKKSSKNSSSKKVSLKRMVVSNKELATEFAIRVHKKFDRMVKASVLFGSVAKASEKPSSDVDVILIIDDASIHWDLELVSWYREELGKVINGLEGGDRLHVNTVKLTTWWQDMLHGDPVVVNVLRYGEALIDSGGFFNPLKALLFQGRVRSTPEAVYAALQRAPAHLSRSKVAMLNAIEGVYWSMVDSAQGALITAGKLPPSPEHIPELLNEVFVGNKLLGVNRVRELEQIYQLHKAISYHDISEVAGADIDKWQVVAEGFMMDMSNIIDRLISEQKAAEDARLKDMNTSKLSDNTNNINNKNNISSVNNSV